MRKSIPRKGKKRAANTRTKRNVLKFFQKINIPKLKKKQSNTEQLTKVRSTTITKKVKNWCCPLHAHTTWWTSSTRGMATSRPPHSIGWWWRSQTALRLLPFDIRSCCLIGVLMLGVVWGWIVWWGWVMRVCWGTHMCCRCL